MFKFVHVWGIGFRGKLKMGPLGIFEARWEIM